VKKSSSFLTALLLAALAVCSWAAEVPHAEPEAVGMASAKLGEVKAAVQKLVAEEKIAGAITMVARKGKIVHFEAYGLRDIEDDAPLEKDSILRFYSMTKPITTVAAMMLHDEGKLKLDEPLEKHLPEFEGMKVHGKSGPIEPDRKPTVRDLMRHTAGLTYGVFGNSPVDRMYKKQDVLGSRDLEEQVKKLGSIPLEYQPGTKWHYSVSTDVLGCVVERVSRSRLDEFFQKRIFEPLDMKDTAFYVPEEKADRFSSCYGRGLRLKDRYDTSRYLRRPTLLSGGGGLVSTARDYMRFCQMLINKGELHGTRLLKTETVEMMTRNQLPENVFCHGLFGFGLGFRVKLKNLGHRWHAGEYGWGGAASTHFWISPADDLVVIALSQYMPFSNQLETTLRPLVYKSIMN